MQKNGLERVLEENDKPNDKLESNHSIKTKKAEFVSSVKDFSGTIKYDNIKNGEAVKDENLTAIKSENLSQSFKSNTITEENIVPGLKNTSSQNLFDNSTDYKNIIKPKNEYVPEKNNSEYSDRVKAQIKKPLKQPVQNEAVININSETSFKSFVNEMNLKDSFSSSDNIIKPQKNSIVKNVKIKEHSRFDAVIKKERLKNQRNAVIQNSNKSSTNLEKPINNVLSAEAENAVKNENNLGNVIKEERQNNIIYTDSEKPDKNENNYTDSKKPDVKQSENLNNALKKERLKSQRNTVIQNSNKSSANLEPINNVLSAEAKNIIKNENNLSNVIKEERQNNIIYTDSEKPDKNENNYTDSKKPDVKQGENLNNALKKERLKSQRNTVIQNNNEASLNLEKPINNILSAEAKNTIKSENNLSNVIKDERQNNIIYTDSKKPDVNQGENLSDVLKKERLENQKNTVIQNNEKVYSNDKYEEDKNNSSEYDIDNQYKYEIANNEIPVSDYNINTNKLDTNKIKPEKNFSDNLLRSAKNNKNKENDFRKKRNIDKNKISQTEKNLGIKSTFKTAVQKELKEYKSITKNIISSKAVNSVKDTIECLGEDNNAFYSLSNGIKFYENSKKGIQATKIIAKTSVNTVKTVVNTPKNVKKGIDYLKKRVNKLQKFVRLSKAQKKVYLKAGVKKAGQKIAKAIVTIIKGIGLKVIAVIAAFVVIFIIIAMMIFAIFALFMWNTSTDLDTTYIISYLSELDYKMQDSWFQGMTGTEIKDYNHDHTTRSVEYNYLLAVDVDPSEVSHEYIKDEDNHILGVSYSGYNESFSSCDELLEDFRWTTDDYRAALAYLQVKNENLGWFASHIGFIGEAVLKSSLRELHKLTYGNEPIDSLTYTDDSHNKEVYYFGKKYSIEYLIVHDMLPEPMTYAEKDLWLGIYNYGNLDAAKLQYPLEGDIDIVKHFGKQLCLEYTPPDEEDEDDRYGSVSDFTGYHYANDLKATSGEFIYAPISGLCKVTQRDGRGFEYVISTSYNGSDIDTTQEGFLVKISCSSSTYVLSSRVVNQGDKIGKVASVCSVNTEIPDSSNDSENEDLFAEYLFPCCTGTKYNRDSTDTRYDYLHIEYYKLPCDFNNIDSIKENVLAPELFFTYPEKEVDFMP